MIFRRKNEKHHQNGSKKQRLSVITIKEAEKSISGTIKKLQFESWKVPKN